MRFLTGNFVAFFSFTAYLHDRFGFALANLGDINKDRYEDLAVGAPYEGKGVVYIYLGSRHGIITEPSQVSSSKSSSGVFIFLLRLVAVLIQIIINERKKRTAGRTMEGRGREEEDRSEYCVEQGMSLTVVHKPPEGKELV